MVLGCSMLQDGPLEVIPVLRASVSPYKGATFSARWLELSCCLSSPCCCLMWIIATGVQGCSWPIAVPGTVLLPPESPTARSYIPYLAPEHLPEHPHVAGIPNLRDPNVISCYRPTPWPSMPHGGSRTPPCHQTPALACV